MKIAIVSDSHGGLDRLDTFFHTIQTLGIKHVIHAGDFAVYGVETIIARYPDIQLSVARGNADINEEILSTVCNVSNCQVEDVVTITLENKKIAVSHIQRIAEGIVKDADVFVHGHTHRLKVEEREGKLILNPGSLYEDGTYLLFELSSLQVEKKYLNEILQ